MKKIAYKGFDKDMKCRGMQYEEGKTYTAEGEIKVCNNGLHACENPLDVLRYYSIAEGSKYHVVECDGDISCGNGDDSKFACRKITIGAELSVGQLIKAGLTAVFEKGKKLKGGKCVQKNFSIAATQEDSSIAAITGCYSTAATTGDCSIAATQGCCSIAATNGYGSTALTQAALSIALAKRDHAVAIASGEHSIAFANGYAAKAKASIGNYLVLTEHDPLGGLKDCKCRKVDGEAIKPDTYYMLVDGEFVEVE